MGRTYVDHWVEGHSIFGEQAQKVCQSLSTVFRFKKLINTCSFSNVGLIFGIPKKVASKFPPRNCRRKYF